MVISMLLWCHVGATTQVDPVAVVCSHVLVFLLFRSIADSSILFFFGWIQNQGCFSNNEQSGDREFRGI